MTINYNAMSLDELRRYVLTYREDLEAFHSYIDRSKAQGRMISIDLNSDRWEEDLTARIQQVTSTEDESNYL